MTDNTTMYELDSDFASLLYQNFPRTLLEFASACCIIFTLIGIPGNLVTIIALACCKKFRNATAVFVINLHISNLIFCCIVLPMTAATYSTQHWIFGETMCSVYPLLKFSLNATAHFTVVAITINRYVLVCHPRLYPRVYKKRILVIILIIIWVASISLFLPSFFEVWGRFGLEPNGGSCTLLRDKSDICPKKIFLCLAFAGPYLIIIVCYSRIWWTVRKATKRRNLYNIQARGPLTSDSGSDSSEVEKGPTSPGHLVCETKFSGDIHRQNSAVVLTSGGSSFIQLLKASFKQSKNETGVKLPTRKDKKLATMIVAILISFAICHFPMMLTRVVYEEYKSNHFANVFAHLMDYASSFISPIIYVIMSSEYRQAYKSLYETLKSKFGK